MLVHILTPFLLCLLSQWTTVTPVLSLPLQSPCHLIQRTALCNNAQLSSVPADLPGSTEELHLNHNQILTLQETSLLYYPSVTTISLVSNGLNKIEPGTFQHSGSVETLNLARNNLKTGYRATSAAFKTLPKLRFLDLSENELDDEKAADLLQSLSSVEYLNLSGNLLSRLDETSFMDLHQLKELDLQWNILFEIDTAFDSNPKLQRLNLAFNRLPCLTDFHMTELVVLNASHNAIEWFISRQDLNDTFQLETLDLSHNKLFFFPFLPNASRLRNLHLSHNSVNFYEHLSDNVTFPNTTRTIEFYNLDRGMTNITAALWDEGLHGDVSSVEILDLSGNQVQYFPQAFIQKMPRLLRLRMYGNCLETLNLTSERFSERLYELDVSNNRLIWMDANVPTLNSLGNLTYLNLSFNSLDRISAGLFHHLSSLRSVDLSYNSISICQSDAGADIMSRCVDWRTSSLRQIYLKGCNLEQIPASAFSGLLLTHLDMSDNPELSGLQAIKSVSRTLQYLGLGRTRITDFDFTEFHRLKSLNISGNALVELPSSLMKLHLELLDLRENQLSTIPLSQAHVLAPKLQTVFLTGNPFNCCQTEWFRTFEGAMINMVGQSEIECQDLFETRRVVNYRSFVCNEEDDNDAMWYAILLVSLCIIVLSISTVVLLTLKPQIVRKPVAKKCFKPTSY
ncbi:transforming growth factor beta activator LRRC33 [Synchiropus splendidus]|uniref:transforming growth factor beta activator LRRC33 n=1 Tax=Synchiropus splendidus TaxID=270530 RepID=UPI00237D71C8|nr:transforming growth factor beta activator LRRC33 [Synchiropus splendidus]XP_053715926.1 transforming growth factor beta activator LRRC33 [Synchiropus splendidus]